MKQTRNLTPQQKAPRKFAKGAKRQLLKSMVKIRRRKRVPKPPATFHDVLDAFEDGDGETLAIYLEGLGREVPQQHRIVLREIARALRPKTEASDLNRWHLEFKRRGGRDAGRPDDLQTFKEKHWIARQVERRLRIETYCARRYGLPTRGLQTRIATDFADEWNMSEQKVQRAVAWYRRLMAR